jgi:HAD superfamily hydrolase (TIGR01509 family)
VGSTYAGTERILKVGFGADFPFDAVTEAWSALYQARVLHQAIDVKPGALELLIRLDELGIPRALATSTQRTITTAKLRNAQLQDFFTHLVCGGETQRGKPHPDPYLEAASRLLLDPDQCWALEDSNNGVRAAHAAGLRVFQVPDLVAPSDEVREAIFANDYYRQLSSSLGGSRELVAMERVLEAVNEEAYDLLIEDTPPAHHALDFLDAPNRLIDLIDGSLTSMLVKPYGLAARAQFNLFRQSSAMTLKFMERLSGFEMLADLSDFLLAFSSMFDGFKERSHHVMALMREPSTTFLLVCAPEQSSLQQVDQFQARLREEALHIAGVLVNRVHLCEPRVDDLDSEELARLSAVQSDRPGGESLSARSRST